MSPSGSVDAVRLEPRPFRPRADGLVACGFVVAVVGCVVGAVTTGHAAFVLGAVYAGMAGLVWLEAFRSTWAVGAAELSSRRWASWRRFTPSDVTAVGLDPGEPGVDVSIGGGRLGRIVIPLDEWRGRPAAVDRLGDFLRSAERRGARIDPAVWQALGAVGEPS